MMHRLQLLLFSVLSLSTTLPGQTGQTDSQALQNLVVEVRQLRQDLKTTAASMERGQILFYRLQVQEAAVDRAIQRLDDARTKLAGSESTRKELASEIKFYEDKTDSLVNADGQKSGNMPESVRADVIAQLKARLDASLSEEQERQAAVTECEERLKVEEAALGVLQEELNQVDRALKAAASQ